MQQRINFLREQWAKAHDTLVTLTHPHPLVTFRLRPLCLQWSWVRADGSIRATEVR